MIVCICNDVTDEEIRELIKTYGIKEIKDLQEKASICNYCRGCTYALEEILKEETASGSTG